MRTKFHATVNNVLGKKCAWGYYKHVVMMVFVMEMMQYACVPSFTPVRATIRKLEKI